ncbi:MAG: alpha/beta hydrolase [Oscillospiraceae bacterium]|nr:alpha/beta hydrolase [Oscillospiraceae bacterium]MBQ8594432.1 alpha/beta hydrolase [Oscillospiraceae bacterium]
MITLLLLILLISYLSYRKAFYSSPKKRSKTHLLPDTPQYAKVNPEIKRLIGEMEAVPFEEVSITTFDGLKLFARYYHLSDSAPIQIQFHGYRSTAVRDFSGGFSLARKMGRNLLVVDQRAGGKSEGTTICFGIKEKYDCLEWIKYALERFGDVPIMLTGVSMGAATVLMASELDLPKNVKCIVADCPYSSPEEIIALQCKEMGIPPEIGMPFVRLGARLFGNLKLSGEGAEKAVRNTKVPILLVHGEEDDFVPCYMSEKIYSANPKMITFETFPNAAHGVSFLVDTERYEKLYYSLFEKYGL